MKIIDRKNFIPIVCIIYTILSLTKIILEAATLGIFGVYQGNLLTILFLAFLATFVMSQHCRLSRFPLLLVALLQYIVLITIVMLMTWMAGLITELHPDAYRDMFLSFTVPYVVLAVIYYISLFMEIKKANQLLNHLKEETQDENSN